MDQILSLLEASKLLGLPGFAGTRSPPQKIWLFDRFVVSAAINITVDRACGK